MKIDPLTQARAAVAGVLAEKAEATAAEQRQQQRIAKAQSEFGELKRRHAHLDPKLAEAERELTQAEEAALAQWCVELAAETVKLHNDDPLANSAAVVANVVKLRAAVRSELNTPINQKYKVHPLVQQAMALQPPLDPMDTPINQLHGHADNWAVRRKAILSEAFPESTPLQAA